MVDEALMRALELIKTRIFITAFLISYFGFFIITIGILNIRSPGFAVGSVDYGFPFSYYQSHSFGGSYIMSGLLMNILFAFGLSMMLSFVASGLWVMVLKHRIYDFSIEEIRRKWYL